jgi:hypothetical protein
MTNTIEPILETPFSNSKLVVCDWCRGTKVIFGKPCAYCDGEGILHRVAEGTVKLFKVK